MCIRDRNMANTPKKVKDPTEVALSAIQEALNISDTTVDSSRNNVGNDMDLYREWAMTICHGRPSQRPSRRLSAGIIALRPSQDGRISGYEGLEAIGKSFGQHIIDAHTPPPGTSTQPVEAGYMANAWLRLKHENYDELRRMLDIVGQTVKVWAN